MAEKIEPSPWRGALAGLAAGLVASAAMDGFQRAIAAMSPGDSDEEPATQQAADAVSGAITGKTIAKPNKPLAGQAVHYGVGALLGVGYGVLAEYRPAMTGTAGTRFALTTVGLLDEAAVPAAGLGPAPWETPPSSHAYSLASHLVFGTTAELTRRLTRAAL